MDEPDRLIEAFEAGTLDSCDFGHESHLRVIWTLIGRYGTLDALRRFESGLKGITERAGQPEKYHATITHVLTFLVAERMADGGEQTWPEFTGANPDLLEWPNPVLAVLYPGDALSSERSRLMFVLPHPAG